MEKAAFPGSLFVSTEENPPGKQGTPRSAAAPGVTDSYKRSENLPDCKWGTLRAYFCIRPKDRVFNRNHLLVLLRREDATERLNSHLEEVRWSVTHAKISPQRSPFTVEVPSACKNGPRYVGQPPMADRHFALANFSIFRYNRSVLVQMYLFRGAPERIYIL